MQCHDIRLLLAFTQRPCESVDAAEREAVAQHLKGCPDCAAFAQAERTLDDALGQVMRDVPAPADLKPKVLKRLAASRGRGRWKWSAAAAAVLLLAIGGGVSWHLHWSRPDVTSDDLAVMAAQDGLNPEQAIEYLAEHGLSVKFPPDFDYFRYLRTVEIVEFKGRRVAKLVLVRADEGVSASILILPNNQFRTNSILDTTVPGWTVEVRRQDDCTYLIFFRGQLERLRPVNA
jgi:hypothetical protein